MSPAVRILRRSLAARARRPALTFAVAGTLALAIAAAVVVATVIRVALLAPLPYPAPGRLAVVHAALPGQQQPFSLLAGPEIAALAAGTRRFAAVGGVWARPGVLRGGDGPIEEIEVGWVTQGFLDALGRAPLLGRLPDDRELVERGGVIVLGHGLWQRRYGGDPAIVGRRIEFDDETVTVVGVMPADFRLWFPAEQGVPHDLQAWLPWGAGLEKLPTSLRVFTVAARLTDDADWPAAVAELDTLGAAIAASNVAYGSSGFALRARPLVEALRAPVRTTLAVLGSVAVLVLVIACANVANLLLAEAQARARELRVRLALGAGRARIWREGLIDVGGLAGLGAVGGLALAALGLRGLQTRGVVWLPRLSEVRLDGVAVAMTAVFALAVTALIGAVVVSAALGAAGRASIHDAGRGLARSPNATRRALVVAQIAMSIVLAAGAGLLVRTAAALDRVDLGFDPDGVVSMRLSLPDVRYSYITGGQRIAEFYRQLDQRVRELPRVVAVGATLNPPLSALPMRPKPYAFRTPAGEVEWGTFAADYRTVTPGWFEAVSARLVAGRVLGDGDLWDRPIAVVVDTRLASRAWPGAPAVGQPIRVELFRAGRFTPTWGEVVGVVQPIRFDDLVSEPREQIYVAHHQSPQRTMYPAIRVEGDPLAIVPSVQAIVGALEPDLPAFDVRLATTHVADAAAETRFALTSLGAAALVAIVLATSGVYAAMAFMTGERRREIAIRLAVGATRASLRHLVLGQGASLVAVGLAAGVLIAAAASRTLAGLLFGVSPGDPVTLAAVALAIAGAALAACWIPAVRASRVPPADVLRG